jgi:D-3-phosphoglycerate dehydrogenase / 2-oxoglutarate reductase
VKVLAVGDEYMPTPWFEQAFARLSCQHKLGYLQLDDRPFEPITASERSIREYLGQPAQVASEMVGVEVLVVHAAPVTAEVLDASSDLRLVACARGGPVNVDLSAATERGIPLAITPGKNADAVADLTIAFCILLARRLPAAARFAQDSNAFWDNFLGSRFIGHDLAGLRLGLVGYGQVGRRVEARARVFDMEILVYDPFIEVPGNDGTVRTDSLEALLADVDIVSLHARATSENVGLIGDAALKTMRRGAMLINTARESLVDEDALGAALESGHIGGAALDVLEPQPRGVRNRLLQHPNVVVTPHIGGATAETLLRGGAMIAEEIDRLAEGRHLQHVANPEVL